MFGRKQIPHNKVDTLVGANSQINGDVSFEGHCHVDGIVKGSVNAEAGSKSALSISEQGTVEGGVSVPYVVLNGKLVHQTEGQVPLLEESNKEEPPRPTPIASAS